MEINCKLTFNIPEELIDALGISEDTVFETYYENGSLHIHPLTEAELAELEDDIDDEDEDDEDEDDYDFDQYHPDYDACRNNYLAWVRSHTDDPLFMAFRLGVSVDVCPDYDNYSYTILKIE